MGMPSSIRLTPARDSCRDPKMKQKYAKMEQRGTAAYSNTWHTDLSSACPSAPCCERQPARREVWSQSRRLRIAPRRVGPRVPHPRRLLLRDVVLVVRVLPAA
jgi:hypothetical protein